MIKSCFTLAVVTLALSASVHAAPVTINNFSFETPVQADGGFVLAPPGGGAGSGVFNSWSFFKTGASNVDFGIENSGTAAYTGAAGAGTPLGANGSQVAFLNNTGVAGSFTSIFQDVGLLQANTTYTLTIGIGQRLDRTNGSVQIALLNAVSGNLNPFGTGTILASTTGVSAVPGSFQDFTATFTTGATITGDLYVGAQFLTNPTIQGSLDNVRLNAVVVPEPSTMLMMLGGIGALVGIRRARRS